MSRPLPRYLPDDHAAWNRKLAQILIGTGQPNPGPTHRIIGGRSAEGDPQRLRGIPAIGRNVGGAIPGTRPDHAT